MTALARAGWLLSAALFGTILSSVLHVDHVGPLADLLLLLVVVVAALRPGAGAVVAVAGAPLAWYLWSQLWNPTVAWAEAIACAALTGFSLNFLRGGARTRRVPATVSAPAILFGTLVIASMIAGLWVKALRLGPGFTDAIVTQVTREYFVDVRGFPALHAGMLLLEGVLLFAAVARIAADRSGDDRFLHRMTAAAAAAATLAAALNIGTLLGAAWRAEFFWASLVDLTDTFRWNVHYGDFNAAGSYFVMAALVAAGRAAGRQGSRRMAWAAATTAIAVAMWLTSSRVAVLAGVIALGGVLLAREISGSRKRAMRAAALGAAGIVLVAGLAVTLPQRGTQKSSFLAADVRLGLMQTGARMIASHPVFGLGLGEFYQRSGEFSTPELVAKFPAAVHENAHNNFLQVAAELGVAAGVLFTWLIAAALVTIARGALSGHPRDPRVMLTLGGLAAFALTCVGGHPLLIREPGYVFWAMLGAATGSVGAAPVATRAPVRWLVAIGLVAIAVTMPWRMRETTREADLEHVGIGVSAWQTSPDDIRYREAIGHATLFIPAGAVKWSVYPLADQPLRLELKLDGRVADIVVLAPRRWNELTLRARTEPPGARFPRLDLRLLDRDQPAMWITKVQPLQ